jgi:hypothetical protein
VGHASDSRCARAFRGSRGVGDDGATHPARSGSRQRNGGGSAARETAASVRARSAESVVAERPLHLRAAPSSARVPRRLHGRLLALRGVVGAGPSPEIESGDRSTRAWHCGVWPAAGGADRSGAAVRGVARRNRVSGATASVRHRAQQESTAASGDARQDRALLEDAVGGVSAQDGVCRLRGLPSTTRALRPALQLPASASRHRQRGAGRSVFSRSTARACGDRSAGADQRLADGAREAAAEAILFGRPSGRPRPQHFRWRGRASRPGRRRIANHPDDQGDRR